MGDQAVLERQSSNRSSLRKRIDNSGNAVNDFVLDDSDLPAKKQPNALMATIHQHRKLLKILGLLVLNGLVFVYFGFATSRYLDSENTCTTNCGLKWCEGYGLLIIIFAALYLGLIYYHLVKPLWRLTLGPPVSRMLESLHANRKLSLILKIAIGLLLVGGIVVYIIFDTMGDVGRLRSLIGMAVLLAISFLISKHKTRINFHTVIFGVIGQVLLGIFCIRWAVGRDIFACMGQKVAGFLGYAEAGATFVFGELVSKGIFAFAVMTVIFFFSLCISVAYFYGAMQFVIEKLGWVLQVLLGTTVIESVTVAANIFLGMSESPFVIRPYIKDLTDSEIHAVMSSGYATVSGTVLAAYISFGAEPAHLITASVMAAPATLAFTKLIYPEVEESKTSSSNIKMEDSEDSTVLEAATSGASAALPVVLGVIANLIAFVSFIAFANALFEYFGGLVGIEGLTIEFIFGKIFTPLAWAMGVDWAECEYVGQLIGLKSIVNEFVAFERLGHYKEQGLINNRSAAIATYAICGFANPSSLGILIGALGALCPEKKTNIIRVAVRALICGSIVCFMTASIAGLLMTDDIYNDIGGRQIVGAKSFLFHNKTSILT